MDKLKNINFALVAFVAFATRVVISGANFSDAAALLVLAALYGGTRYMQDKLAIAKAEQASKYSDEALKTLADKIEKDIADVRSSVAGVKLGASRAGFRNVSGNGQ